MMKLKDFIEQSVSDIADATQKLKQKYNLHSNNKCHVIAAYKESSLDYNSHAIDFDIAVTTSENGTAKAGSKIGISVLGANINGERGYNNENTSRIKFSIPFYPEYIDKNQK